MNEYLEFKKLLENIKSTKQHVQVCKDFITDFIKKEFDSFTKNEKIFFPIILLIIILVSIITKDNKLALIGSLCSVIYTLLAGKGKLYCFVLGLIGTAIYAYFTLQNHLWGKSLLYILYYIPIQIIGIFLWKKNLKKDTVEIIKTHLPIKQKFIYFGCTAIATIAFAFLFNMIGDYKPFFSSFIITFSITAQLLATKRCIDQWGYWFFVNIATILLWTNLYIENKGPIAYIIVYMIYLILSIYFFKTWKKEITKKQN
jgi:nicotinamide mononucleotide transporter